MKLSFPVNRFLVRAGCDERLLPSHISLFIAIFFYSDQEKPNALFSVSRKKLMRFSRIKSIVTYHKCIRELVAYGYITYQPSYDPFRASMISMNINSSKHERKNCSWV